jgi:membrane-bound lytic murein transglycosylase
MTTLQKLQKRSVDIEAARIYYETNSEPKTTLSQRSFSTARFVEYYLNPNDSAAFEAANLAPDFDASFGTDTETTTEFVNSHKYISHRKLEPPSTSSHTKKKNNAFINLSRQITKESKLN